MTKKISFEINTEKTLEAILYVAQKLGGEVNQYNLMKIFFEADKYHLNKYARPVTGDIYIAMPYGTVPSSIKDFIAGNELALASMGIEEYPFSKEGHFVKIKRDPKMDFLSESDVEALDVGISEYGHLTFQQVHDKNHEEKAWLETYHSTPNQVIAFEDIIDNKDILEYLSENSHSIVI